MPSNFTAVSGARAPFVSLGALSLALAAVVMPGAGWAQSAAPAESGALGTQAAAEIIVTGSRLARSTFDAPTPVTVLGGEEFDRLAITNVGEGISELPAFRPSTNPTTQGFGSFNVGAQIVNLRGLGVTRNLILVDGRRFAPTTREGSVDLNFIPSILVARSEIVTGGASAAYGSDALAGAVNIILDKTLDGFKGQIDQGISDKGDGRDFHAALAWGTDLGGGNGHFVIGGEYDNQKGIGNCFTRDWCKSGAIITNPGYAANGQPNYIRSDDNAGWFINNAGVISGLNNTTPATAGIRNLFGTGGITFNPDGSPAPYSPGSPAFALSQIGGDLYPTYTNSNITVPVERYTAFAHADYDFNDSLSGFVEASYGHVRGELLQSSYFSASLPIYAENPFIPDELRTFVPTVPTRTERPAAAAFNLGRAFDDLARGLSISTADTYRGTLGLSGKFSDRWSWDTYYQYGRTDRMQTVENNLILGDPAQSLANPASYAASNARFYYALDAVPDPVTGAPTCRALLSGNAALRQAAAGCVPVNMFGTGNASQSALDYIYGTLVEDIRLQQHVLAGNVRGDLGELWAGPLSIAAGAEYRVDKIDVAHDTLSNQYAYFQNFGSDYNGKAEVIEGYLEAELPLIRDASFTKSLSLNGAIRQTHYNITGFGSYLRTASKNEFDATAWKASLLWEPVDWLRLRATQSRDIRAPNFADLYLASASSFTPILNRFNPSQSTPPSIVNGGTPFLKPEKGDTTTVGIVLSPHDGFLRGFRLSVDYYDIKVKGYIAQPPGGAQFIIDRCYDGVAEACGLINPLGITAGQDITEIRNVSLNLDKIRTKGVDIEAEYRIPLGGENNLLLRGLATYVDELTTVSFGDRVDRAGQTGNSVGLAAPKWTLNGFATFATPRASITLQGRYIDSGLYDAQRIGPDDPDYSTSLANSISNNRVASRFYVNLFGSITVAGDEDRKFELFGSVNNLFDRDPPAAPETQFYTNPIYFDTIGRYYRIGARFRY